MINQYKNLKPDGEKCFTYQASKFTWKESGSLGCYLLAKAKSFEAPMWLSDGFGLSTQEALASLASTREKMLSLDSWHTYKPCIICVSFPHHKTLVILLVSR